MSLHPEDDPDFDHWPILNLPGHKLLTVGDLDEQGRVWHAECPCGWKSEPRRVAHEPAGLFLEHIQTAEPIEQATQQSFDLPTNGAELSEKTHGSRGGPRPFEYGVKIATLSTDPRYV